ncbi:MAG: hypothetical protein H0T21_03465, partial [Gemmatimonadaceae bacterium]|nr:hypothetical protein [Gemmatimonadaceae bacterium]
MNRKTLAFLASVVIAAPAVSAAQTGGLSRVQLLALQQELKEQCGLRYATGRMDGPTRRAIAVCKKKHGVTGSAADLLAAMNVGFGTGDNSPQGMGGLMGNKKDSDETVLMDNSGTNANRARRARVAREARMTDDEKHEADLARDAAAREKHDKMKDHDKMK